MQGEGRLEISSRLQNGHVSITIKDEGPGLADEQLKQVFEPFFTTNDPGQGYGLGLAVSQRIIVESGGKIDACSGHGQGACFTVTLPCDTETPV